MGDDADDARYAEERREQRLRDRRTLGIATHGEQMAARGLPLGFGPKLSPLAPDEADPTPLDIDPTGYEGRLPPSNVGTTTTYGGPWGPFEFTAEERMAICVKIADFASAVMQSQGWSDDDVKELLNEIEAEIARGVDQQG